jgi:hypothetical protein
MKSLKNLGCKRGYYFELHRPDYQKTLPYLRHDHGMHTQAGSLLSLPSGTRENV